MSEGDGMNEKRVSRIVPVQALLPLPAGLYFTSIQKWIEIRLLFGVPILIF